MILTLFVRSSRLNFVLCVFCACDKGLLNSASFLIAAAASAPVNVPEAISPITSSIALKQLTLKTVATTATREKLRNIFMKNPLCKINYHTKHYCREIPIEINQKKLLHIRSQKKL